MSDLENSKIVSSDEGKNNDNGKKSLTPTPCTKGLSKCDLNCSHDGSVVKSIYDQQQNFVLIGLTGRIGAGCSTVAGILHSKTFENIDTYVPDASDEREQNILNNYLSGCWKEGFTLLRVSDIILHHLIISEPEIKNLTHLLKRITAQPSAQQPKKSDNNETPNDDKLNQFENEYKTVHDQALKVRFALSTNSSTNKETEGTSLVSYLKKLADIRQKIEGEMTKKNLSLILEHVANIMRKHGMSYDEVVKAKENATTTHCRVAPSYLAQQVDLFISAIRKSNEKPITRIVLDSLRNPYEIRYFQCKYSSFYLISIHMDAELRRKKLKQPTVDALHSLEHESKECSFADSYQKVNISKCIELSDIYISNTGNKNFLARQLLRYVALILHPGLVPPTPIERCMQIAHSAKASSGCLSRQVGAAVTYEDFSICSVGWNTTPDGQVPCNLRNLKSLIEGSDDFAFSHYEKNNQEFCGMSQALMAEYERKGAKEALKGLPLSYCFKDLHNNITKKGNQVHTRSIHAEEHAFLNLAKYGTPGIQGGKLFTTASCCELCAKKAYHLGIREIYYIDVYPGISEQHILDCGVKRPKMIHFFGASGVAFTKIYTPILPYKDELEYITDVKVKMTTTANNDNDKEL